MIRPSSFFFALLPCLLPCTGQAATLIQNDFESVTAGNYGNGDSFGPAPLGNKSLNSIATVGATGAGGSAGLSSSNGGVSSSAEFSITETTSFEFLFQYTSDASNRPDMFVVAGWSKLPTNSLFGGTSPIRDNSYYVGLERVTGDTMAFASGFGNGGSALTGSPTFDLQNGHFYEFSGGILWDGSEWDYSNLTIQDYGATGTTPGSVLNTPFSVSRTPATTEGINVTTSGQAFFSIGGNGPRGAGVFDNISVVPEPQTALLLSLGLSTLLFRRRAR